MKRFTETNKWRDPWYRKLSSPAKQLWEYVRDNCDAIGLIDIDLGLITADCGQEISSDHVKELGDRIQKTSDTKYFLPKFINFQYGELSKSCPPHRNIIKQVESHGLIRVGLHYRYPNATLSSQVVEDQQNHYPNARVALPYRTRQDKNVQDRDLLFKSTEVLRIKLVEVFCRLASDPWTNMEEAGLCEVARRPQCLPELEELITFKQKRGKYFPQSIGKLLENWTSALDAARNGHENGRANAFKEYGTAAQTEILRKAELEEFSRTSQQPRKSS